MSGHLGPGARSASNYSALRAARPRAGCRACRGRIGGTRPRGTSHGPVRRSYARSSGLGDWATASRAYQFRSACVSILGLAGSQRSPMAVRVFSIRSIASGGPIQQIHRPPPSSRLLMKLVDPVKQGPDALRRGAGEMSKYRDVDKSFAVGILGKKNGEKRPDFRVQAYPESPLRNSLIEFLTGSSTNLGHLPFFGQVGFASLSVSAAKKDVGSSTRFWQIVWVSHRTTFPGSGRRPMELTASFLVLLQQFVPVFTAPTFLTFLQIANGWILSQRHHFLTEIFSERSPVGACGRGSDAPFCWAGPPQAARTCAPTDGRLEKFRPPEKIQAAHSLRR